MARIALTLLLLLSAVCCAGQEKYDQARKRMVEDQLLKRDIVDEKVLAAMGRVPRHLFVPEIARALAYSDQPLPIGMEQTISQPYIVALMTQLADVSPDDVVLEVGTGSGYQAAVLAEIVREVYTIEIVEELASTARERLARLGYQNVTVRAGDGYLGWEEKAPFDAILVTAAAPEVPPPLIEQLAPGGFLVIPVGAQWEIQRLLRIEKDQGGKTVTREIIPVRFVPLVRPPK